MGIPLKTARKRGKVQMMQTQHRQPQDKVVLMHPDPSQGIDQKHLAKCVQSWSSRQHFAGTSLHSHNRARSPFIPVIKKKHPHSYLEAAGNTKCAFVRIPIFIAIEIREPKHVHYVEEPKS